MSDVVIVPMEESHFKDVADIEAKCFSNPWAEVSFACALLTPSDKCYVALDNGKVVGYIVMLHCLDEGELLNIAVSPDMRNMGIAQKLMDSMYSFMKEKNVARLLLEVRESNAPAKNLYIKNGFSPIAVRKNYYTKPTENAVVMEKYI